MPVPEASVDENYGSMPRKRDVGPPRQIGPMKPETVAQPMKCTANGHLGTGVPGAYARHVRASFWIDWYGL
mgnify:CR=1 FL=1